MTLSAPQCERLAHRALRLLRGRTREAGELRTALLKESPELRRACKQQAVLRQKLCEGKRAEACRTELKFAFAALGCAERAYADWDWARALFKWLWDHKVEIARIALTIVLLVLEPPAPGEAACDEGN